jgi:polar amino acid transport system permease protein
MVPSRKSRASGSADIAWYCVLFAALTLFAGLLLFGPESGSRAPGVSYNPFPEMLKRLVHGLLVTGQIVLFSLTGSVVLGIMVGVGRVSRFRAVNTLASMYVETIRGIPLLVILFMIYYGLNQYLPQGYKLNEFWSAVSGLCICYGAFMGEAVRAGIQAIPPEEQEAASLEAGRWDVLRYVTLPRSLRTILPAGANECIALLKDTSIVSVIALSELTRTGQEYASSKFLFFETYVMVALIYLLITLLLSRGVRVLEKTWN